MHRFLLVLVVAASLVGLVPTSSGCAGTPSRGNDDDGPADDDSSGGAGGGPASSSSSGGANASTGAGAGGGGGGDPAICVAAPCGGEVVGAWAYAPLCLDAPATPFGCEGSTTTSVFYLEGELELGADLIATVTRALVQETEVSIPKTCLAQGQSCATAVQGADECLDLGASCLCTSLNKQPPESATDPYSTAGTTMTIGSGAEVDTLEYCVAGDTLKLLHEETGEETYLVRK